MKRKLFALAAAVILLLICAYDTIAYFTVTDRARNVVTTATLDAQIVELDANGDPFTDPFGITPGARVTKVVTVKNNGTADCWVRVRVDKSFELEKGAEGTPDLSLVSLDFNSKDWIQKGDHWYYSRALSPGEETEPLFTTVSFDISMTNLYKNGKAVIDVAMGAVQTAHNGSSVLEAAGWPE